MLKQPNLKRMELLDQALAGQSAEVKARVQDILLRYNIDVDNEFFLIFTAIGHLLAIVDESPENWRALFDDFERELDEWSTQNLRTLAAIQEQGAAADRMSQSFLRLTDSLLKSSSKTASLQGDLIKLSKTLQLLNERLEFSRSESQALSQRFNQTERFIESSEKKREWILIGNYVMTGALTIGVLAVLWMQIKQTERIGWMLQKANRQECFLGVKAADDPQCRQYQ